MEAQYTSGPWQTHGIRPVTMENNQAMVHLDEPFERWAVKRVYFDEQNRRCHQFVASVHVTAGHEDETEANARLIAAAPDMLSLLRELIDIEGPQPGTADWARKAQSVIAKATGAST